MKKSFKRNLFLLIAPCAVFLASQSAFSATVLFSNDGVGDNWDVDANWTGGFQPGEPGGLSSDVAVIDDGDTVTLNTSEPERETTTGIAELALGQSAPAIVRNNTLNIEAGANLDVDTVTIGSGGNGTNTINMSGGSISLGSVSLNSSDNLGNSSFFNLSGGTLTFDSFVIGKTSNATGLLNIIGDAGSLSGTSMTINTLGTLQFTMEGATSTVELSGNFDGSAGKLVIDWANYSYLGRETITLVDANSITGSFDPANITHLNRNSLIFNVDQVTDNNIAVRVSLPDAQVYIGDAAAEGPSVTRDGGTVADTLDVITYIMHTGSPTIYTVPEDQHIRLKEVNFFADEGGTLTPFLARFLGGDGQVASNYEILVIGDALTVTSSDESHLENRIFTVASAYPVISLKANDMIVAGWLQDGHIVLKTSTTQGTADYVAKGDSLSGAQVGGTPTGDSKYAFDRSMRINIGFDIMGHSVAILSPAADAVYGVCESVSFVATVNDPVDDNASLEAALDWTSDLESGSIGSGASFSLQSLRIGTHTITAMSTNSDLNVALDTITITVTSLDLGAIWFIGDSITQSNADGDSQGSPRKSLYDLLTADSAKFSFTGHRTKNVDGLPGTGGSAATNLYHYHSGISGSYIGTNSNGRTDMTAGIPGWWNQGRLATVKPSAILIMLGTNDINNNADVANAPTRIRQLVNTILDQLQGGEPMPAIFVAQITPNNDPIKAQSVVDFNDALPAIISTLQSEGKDVTLVDQFTRINANKGGLMRDTLHTNAAGNDILAEQWYNALKERFKPIGFQAWQIMYFGSPCAVAAGPNLDSDSDGIINLIEYALGQNPNVPDQPASNLTAGEITFSKGPDVADDVTYAIEESDDIGISDPWEAVIPNLNNSEEISSTLPTGKPAHFVRLKLTLTP